MKKRKQLKDANRTTKSINKELYGKAKQINAKSAKLQRLNDKVTFNTLLLNTYKRIFDFQRLIVLIWSTLNNCLRTYAVR